MKIKRFLNMLLAVIVILAGSVFISAASVPPTRIDGNTGAIDGYVHIKLDDWNDLPLNIPTTFIVKGYKIVVTVTTSNGSNKDNYEISFETEEPVFYVTMKGGPMYHQYDYTPNGILSDTGLTTPMNKNSGKNYGISHIDFYFSKEPIVVTTTIEPTTISTIESTTKDTVETTKDTIETTKSTDKTTADTTVATTVDATTTTTEDTNATTTEDTNVTTTEDTSTSSTKDSVTSSTKESISTEESLITSSSTRDSVISTEDSIVSTKDSIVTSISTKESVNTSVSTEKSTDMPVSTEETIASSSKTTIKTVPVTTITTSDLPQTGEGKTPFWTPLLLALTGIGSTIGAVIVRRKIH